MHSTPLTMRKTLLLCTTLLLALTLNAQVKPVRPVDPIRPVDPVTPVAPTRPLGETFELRGSDDDCNCPLAQGGGTNVTISGPQDGPHTTTITQNGTTLKMTYEGEFAISDNDQDVTVLNDGGYFMLQKTVFGSKHKIEIRNENGQQVKRYWEGSREQPWEPDGRKWLAELLPQLVRTTTIGAESRVKRFYAKGGATAVLDEIGELESDHVRAHYGKLLLRYPLNAQQFNESIRRLANSVRSDYYLSGLLKSSLTKSQSPGSVTAVLAAVQKVSSDYYRADVLEAAITRKALDGDDFKEVLKATTSMGSDYYKAGVLEKFARAEGGDKNQVAYFEAASTIASDYYRSGVLSKGFRNFSLTTTGLFAGMQAWATMGSDFYQHEVLMQLVKTHKLTPDAQKLVLTPLGSGINSDMYKQEVLKAFARGQNMPVESVKLYLNAANTVGSDMYKAESLKALRQQSLDDASQVVLYGAVKDIGSDMYKSEVLKQYAALAASSGESARTAFKSAAKSITSSHYFGDLMRSID